ncbi:MAG: hypothetical protein WBR35_24610 [Anaerolineae bacterium]
MPTVLVEDISAYIKLKTPRPGIGQKSWDDLFPPGETLDLTNVNPILARLIKPYQEIPPDSNLERLFDLIGSLRISSNPSPGNPFLDPSDPTRQLPIHGGTLNPKNLRKGMLTVMVSGHRSVADPPDGWNFPGVQSFHKQQAEIGTATWQVKGIPVLFLLHEGLLDNDLRDLGRWTFIDDFKLEEGQSVTRVYKRSKYLERTWWRLTVIAQKSVPGTFTAPPFAY